MLLKTFESRRDGGKSQRVVGGAVAVTLMLVCGTGCGPEDFPEPHQEATGHMENTLSWGAGIRLNGLSLNGLHLNGLHLNGLHLNGLHLNGLHLNGLHLNGLSTSSFHDWFQAAPTERDEVMKYLVACAVPAGQTRSYSAGGTTHAWTGVLGLAPGWASGAAATLAEQQVVSACMAAHGNKEGIHVSISLLGRDATGTPIATTSQESADYTLREACFFGNLFDGSTGVFSGNDGLSLTSTQSSPRVCGMGTSSNATQCAPMGFVGSCATHCTPDATGTFYTACSYGGTTYAPITTRMNPEDIYTCGDGVCQATEVSGKAGACAADCG